MNKIWPLKPTARNSSRNPLFPNRVPHYYCCRPTGHCFWSSRCRRSLPTRYWCRTCGVSTPSTSKRPRSNLLSCAVIVGSALWIYALETPVSYSYRIISVFSEWVLITDFFIFFNLIYFIYYLYLFKK